MAVITSSPWCRRPEIKVSMSYWWGCWCRSCRPHLQQSRHGENDFTLPSRHHRRGEGGDKSPKPRNLAWRDPNPKDSIYWKNLLKTMDPHSLRPLAICRRGREGDQRWWTRMAAAAALTAHARRCLCAIARSFINRSALGLYHSEGGE
jgi:hypothetical protein